MLSRSTRLLLHLLAFTLPGMKAYSQAICPPNIDFEDGDFTNWVCKAGTVSAPGNVNTLNLYVTPPLSNRHEIITFSNTSKDRYGGFPVLCPNGSGYSVKLGNEFTGSEAEGISYTYNIPVTASNFSILYNYAVVFQNPGHDPPEQPRFRARVINLTDGDTINCVAFDFTSSANLPGFKQSTVDPEVLYKDWTPVSLNLRGYQGKTIMVEFITSDCTRGGHFGYGYVDVNSQCNGSVIGSTICIGDTSVTLVAPYGYETYTWYTDQTFGQVLDTLQSVTINPAPSVGTVYPVIVNPYPGFGCKDTIYATIGIDSKPPSYAGPDTTLCRRTLVQLGTAPNPAYLYTWTPANLVTNPVIANPKGFNNTFTPQSIIVKTTKRTSGCFSYDTVVIRSVQVDTSLVVNGKTNYCIGEPYYSSMTISNQSTNIQWLLNNTPISGATANQHTPLSAGSYCAKFEQLGCIDTTRRVVYADHVSPTVKFQVNKDTQCISNNSFVFTNQTTILNNEQVNYVWTFGDGSLSQLVSPVRSYPRSGTFQVWLHATSQYNCSDSTFTYITVLPNAAPEFMWDTACTNAVIRFVNNTNENGSKQVNYTWDFGNGAGSLLKTPLPFLYPAKGIYTVSLEAVAKGCESYPQGLSKKVTVYEPKPGIRYRDITLPSTYSMQLLARWDVGNKYRWTPATQLSDRGIRTPYFKAINDVKYHIAITDEHNCITTDTLQMYVLTKKGWYLPNAFTPNRDGLNDMIRPYLQGMIALKRFSVYNRVGNLIFSTTRDGEGWDGTYKGVPAEAGTYVWFLEYMDENNKVVSHKGSLMLVR